MSSEKVKILFVIDHLDGGGAEKQCLNVVNNINRAGFEPCLFLTEKQGILFKKLKTFASTLAFPVEIVVFPPVLLFELLCPESAERTMLLPNVASFV